MNSLVSLNRVVRCDASTRSPTILIVDPKLDMEGDLALEFRKRDFVVFIAHDYDTAVQILASVRFDFAVVELRLRGRSGFEVVKEIATRQPTCRVFVSSDYCDLRATVWAVKCGAYDVFPKSMPVMLLVGLVLGDELDALAASGCFKRPEQIRRDHIIGVYAALDHNVSRSARRLSMHRRTLQRYLGQHGLT